MEVVVSLDLWFGLAIPACCSIRRHHPPSWLDERPVMRALRLPAVLDEEEAKPARLEEKEKDYGHHEREEPSRVLLLPLLPVFMVVVHQLVVVVVQEEQYLLLLQQNRHERL
jgi:hypothetical protein